MTAEKAVSAAGITKIYPLYNKKSDRLIEALDPRKRPRHRDFYALQDVSFQIEPGECVGFVGRNGSGKSTLLKILTGVLTPSQGTFALQGKVSALLELGAGFNMEYTGIENIYLNATVMGFSRSEIDARLPDILEFADIGEFVYQPVKMYSSGMFVRLAFALAINVDPDILIVDEALSVGDSYFQQKCYRKFMDFKRSGKTILFVTHDMGSVIKYCNRAYLLDSGRIVSSGRPKTIVDQYKKLLAGIAFDAQAPDEPQAEEAALPEDLEPGASWKSHYTLNREDLTYGSGDLEITDFGIFDEQGRLCAALNKGGTYTIRMKVEAHADVTDPIFAFTIKDVKGNEITGTNTYYEDIGTGTLKKGDVLTVSFTQRVDLQGSQFFLSLGATKYLADGTLKVYHRLYDVLELNILSAKTTVGWFDPNSVITIEKENPAKS
ncbi:MAG: ABC transporter ATP-binding protein [Clostridia bacterium]|nr:ABC transporter ATP-binding protein [Clostridia bacterium]